jgi:peptide/nickel transport system substrate-binding protein
MGSAAAPDLTPDKSAHGLTTKLVVSVPYEPHGFNEVYRNFTGGGGYYVANNIFNRLVVVDVFEDGTIRPDLAERWEILDGGATYRFHLRAARWHDGQPFCAADVRETYLTAIREGYRAAASLGDVKDIVVRDDRTVDIQLHRPNSGFLAQLSIFVWTHILPAHLYAGTDWTTNPANDRPIGTGPYRFREWRRGHGVTVEANPDYHNGRPAVDEIEFKVIPDLSDALTQLVRGDVDYCTQDIPCERYDELVATPGVGIASGSGNAVNHLTLNFDRTPWQDKRVREAVASSLDRDRIARAVCPRAEPARFAYLERVTWAFEPAARFPDLDRTRARRLLDNAGLRPGQDGIRIRAMLACRGLFPFHVRMAEGVASDLEQVGIAIDVVRLDAAQWKDRVVDRRDFDLVADGLGIGPDPIFLEEILASDAPLNVAHYRNGERDEMFLRGKATSDRSGRAVAYRAAQRVIAAELPRVHVIRHVNHHAYRTAWSGWSWEPPARGTVPFWSLEHVRARTPEERRAA